MQRKCTSGVSVKKSDRAVLPHYLSRVILYEPPLCNQKSTIQFSFSKSPLIPLNHSSNNSQPAKVCLSYSFGHSIFVVALLCRSTSVCILWTFHFEVTCHSIDIGFRLRAPAILPSPYPVSCFSQTKSPFSSQHGNPEDPCTLRLRQPRQSDCRG